MLGGKQRIVGAFGAKTLRQRSIERRPVGPCNRTEYYIIIYFLDRVYHIHTRSSESVIAACVIAMLTTTIMLTGLNPSESILIIIGLL